MMFTIVYPCVPENMECRCCLPFVWVKHLLTNKDRETGGPKKRLSKSQVQSGARYVATKPPISTHPQVRGIIYKDAHMHVNICVCPAIKMENWKG